MSAKLTNKDIDNILISQERYIKKHFGYLAGEFANYGWGTGNYTVATKIYDEGVLESYIVKRGKKRIVVHVFDSF